MELIGEHGFSFGKRGSRRRGAHASDKAPPFPKKGLASDRIFGEDQNCEILIFSPACRDTGPASQAGLRVSGLQPSISQSKSALQRRSLSAGLRHVQRLGGPSGRSARPYLVALPPASRPQWPSATGPEPSERPSPE